MSNATFRAIALGLAAVTAVASGCTASSDSLSSSNGNATASAEDLSYCGTPTVEGIDVSEHNGHIDWSAVAGDHISFAFIKATQSAADYSYDDPRFATNWAAAKSAHVIRSAYHFFDPTIDGVAQAEHFLAKVGPLGEDDLPPMLDLECPTSLLDCRFSGDTVRAVDPAVITRRALDFLETVEARTGKRPMVYTYRYWFSDAGGVDGNAFSKYPLFYAAYASPNACVTMPTGWSKWTFRQYDDGTNGFGRSVAGVGSVDIDRFDGSLTQLRAFAKKATPIETPPTTGGSCPQGNGHYCGGNGVSGSTLALYRCEDGDVSKIENCALGCERMPDGQDDRCKSGSSCPLGDGDYCGGNHVGGNPKELYHCEGGTLSKIEVCHGSCEVMPDGEDDVCASTSGGGSSSALGSKIVTVARSYLGYYEDDGNYCNKFSTAMGRGCEQWCADYADWVWKKAGASIGGLDGSAISFYRYATTHHTWKDGKNAANVSPGDAVIWANGYGWAEHVGIVTAVHANGTISVINGDFFMPGDALSSVDEVTISRDDDVGTNAPILGYASPAD